MPHLLRIDDALYTHFITFSCYHRRRLLDHDQPKRIILGVLSDELGKFNARCVGFVLMPDHVHALIWFSQTRQLSRFLQQWKGRSSMRIKPWMQSNMTAYLSTISSADPVWQVRFHSFEIDSHSKVEEKLAYIHANPVRAGLVERAVDWPWSSARWYLEQQSVGVPIEWVG